MGDIVLYKCPTSKREYTYSTLLETASRFGSGLQANWAWRKGDVLALFAQNCIDTPAVTWGAHWAGGIVSPANPAYNLRELVHHLKDSGAKALVTQRGLLGVALKAATEVGIGRDRIVLIGEDVDRRYTGFMHLGDMLGDLGCERVKIRKEDLAFLVYSSGTTGYVLSW